MTDMVAVEVTGIRELRRALEQVEKGMGREVGQAGKRAADMLTPLIRGRVPARSGRAGGSVRAVTVQGGGGVRAGGAKAPYYPWLDFGGRVGRRHATVREFIPQGRYVYPTFDAHRQDVVDVYAREIAALLERAGLV